MLSQKLKEYRRQNGLTQQELADQLFISRSAVAKWEQGKGIPSKEILSALCVLLDCTKEELLNHDETVSVIEHVEKSSKKKVIVAYIVAFVFLVGIVIALTFSLKMHFNGKIIFESVSPDKQIKLTVYDKPHDSSMEQGFTIEVSGQYRGTWIKEDCEFIGLYWSSDSRYLIEEYYSKKLGKRYFEYTDFHRNAGVNLQLMLDEKVISYYSIKREDILKLEYEFIRWDTETDIMLFNFDLVYNSTYISGYFWSTPVWDTPLQGLTETKKIVS